MNDTSLVSSKWVVQYISCGMMHLTKEKGVTSGLRQNLGEARVVSSKLYLILFKKNFIGIGSGK